jgi:hypothetical protein
MGSGAGIVAALHGVNALAIVAVGVLTIRYASTLTKGSIWFEDRAKSAGTGREAASAAKK